MPLAINIYELIPAGTATAKSLSGSGWSLSRAGTRRM